jgi:hypothetical protein
MDDAMSELPLRAFDLGTGRNPLEGGRQQDEKAYAVP